MMVLYPWAQLIPFKSTNLIDLNVYVPFEKKKTVYTIFYGKFIFFLANPNPLSDK